MVNPPEQPTSQEQKLRTFLERNALTPPPAPSQEYTSIIAAIQSRESKTLRSAFLWRILTPGLALSLLLGFFWLHHRTPESDIPSTSVAMTVPSSLLLFDPSLSPEEFRSPIEDWNTLAESVTASKPR